MRAERKVRSRSRQIPLVVLLLNTACASVHVASPQAVKPFDPFGLPGSVLLCRARALPKSAPPGSIGFQFEDGTLLVNDRLISIAYDSVGNPFLLVMNATEKLGDGQPIMHLMSVSFPSGEPAEGFQFVQSPNAGDTTEPKREPLSSAMLTESRNLAVWLWNHRCSRST
jgi:hypothetical protein